MSSSRGRGRGRGGSIAATTPKFNPTIPNKHGLEEINKAYYTITLPKQQQSSSTLRVGCLNVLFDIFDKAIIYSELRWKKQFELMKKLDFDLLGLSEVTLSFLNLFFSQKFITDNYYYVYDIELANDTTGNDFGNLILSKYEIKEAYRYFYNPKVQSRRPAIVAIVEIPIPTTATATTAAEGSSSTNTSTTSTPSSSSSIRVGVISVHFKAGTQGQLSRSKQIQEIFDLLQYQEDSLKQKLKCDEVIVLGDFNLMNAVEDAKYLDDEKYCDVWKHLRPSDPGITFDAVNNTLIHKMDTEDKRQMRLDRILLRKNKTPNRLVPADIAIWANEPLTREKKSNSYLYPSDHYGLVASFQLK